MLILLIGSLILLGPLIVYLSWWGFAIFLLLYLVGIYAGGNVDKIKYKMTWIITIELLHL